MLAGSCSKATLEQIRCYEESGGPCIKLDPEAMIEGTQTLDAVWEEAKAAENGSWPPLVYSSDTPERVKEYQKLGQERVAALLEDAAASLAAKAVEEGYTRIISAGGETSGAVTRRLGFSSYWIGESVAPGVPVMTPAGRPRLRLVLKSGNFGQRDFFRRAVQMTGKEEEM